MDACRRRDLCALAAFAIDWHADCTSLAKDLPAERTSDTKVRTSLPISVVTNDASTDFTHSLCFLSSVPEWPSLFDLSFCAVIAAIKAVIISVALAWVVPVATWD